MSFLARLKKACAVFGKKRPQSLLLDDSALTRGHDTAAAVRELTRVFSTDPKAVELSLALGNLFRAQGDLERAVKLRENLLARNDIDVSFRCSILFELACDYRRAGLLDRALETYQEAEARGVSKQIIQGELAQLHADSGNFNAAAQSYNFLNNPLAEAHFLVRQAEECAVAGNDMTAQRLLKKATSVYPPSPEAWLALASMALLGGNKTLTKETMLKGLEHTLPSGRLLLLEGLHALTIGKSKPELPPEALQTLVETLTATFSSKKPDLLQYYYGGLFLQAVGKLAEAESWYTKALVLEPEFWATRLHLMEILAAKESLSPLLATQVAFFVKQKTGIKRFLCNQCSLRREHIFYNCPRCHTWHSVDFRFSLQ